MRIDVYKCSLCGHGSFCEHGKILLTFWTTCPKCGVKMELVENGVSAEEFNFTTKQKQKELIKKIWSFLECSGKK